MKEFLSSTHRSKGTAQTVRWLCNPITLSIGDFESPTEVQLSSLAKHSQPLINQSLIMQTNFYLKGMNMLLNT